MVCSMWQIIRHANQAEAAVESLIMVRVPHKGTSPPPRAPPDSGSPPPPFTSTPILPCCPCTPRQTDGPEAEAESVGGEESLGKIGWYGWLWHRGWSGYVWIWEGGHCLFLDSIEVSV